jgi:hypothetical protein
MLKEASLLVTTDITSSIGGGITKARSKTAFYSLMVALNLSLIASSINMYASSPSFHLSNLTEGRLQGLQPNWTGPITTGPSKSF